jgi:hypothetical protein
MPPGNSAKTTWRTEFYLAHVSALPFSPESRVRSAFAYEARN